MFESVTLDGKRSLDHLEDEIAELSGHINAATCRWLLLIAEFDGRRGHEQSGFGCCATWLAWRCGVAPRAAREHLRVARALGGLDAIREAFARGELSYSKVRAVTRVATPESESDLLELALHATAAQLERIVRAYRGALTVDEANALDERRSFAWSWEDDGSLSLRGRLAPEEGALFLRAFEAAWDAVREQRKAEDTGEMGEPATGAERRRTGSAEPVYAAMDAVTPADALVEMADASLRAGGAGRTGGERHQVVVHVDQGLLSGADDGSDGRTAGRCQLEDGSALAAETARRLSCDASVVRFEERDGQTLSVGRKKRTVPPAMRRALRARDGGCRFPGCGNHRFTDAHHIEHWAHGGETSLTNLVQLCRRHHRLLHEGGFTLEIEPDGGLIFRRRDGRRLAPSPAVPRNRGCEAEPSRAVVEAPGAGQIHRSNRARGLAIDAETGRSRSNGAPFDLDLTVDVLCQHHPVLPRPDRPQRE